MYVSVCVCVCVWGGGGGNERTKPGSVVFSKSPGLETGLNVQKPEQGTDSHDLETLGVIWNRSEP